MPRGIYQHKSNQGFQKGSKNPSKSIEARKRISEQSKGRVPPNRGIPLSDDQKRRISEKLKGRRVNDSLENWRKNGGEPWNKGTAKAEYRNRHGGTEYRLWRLAVYERDCFTCQICKKIGGKLNADHIKRWSKYPELRFELSNGRTLCVDCHKKTDTYGNKK